MESFHINIKEEKKIYLADLPTLTAVALMRKGLQKRELTTDHPLVVIHHALHKSV